MIQLKLCKIGDVVKGAWGAFFQSGPIPFSNGVVLSHNHPFLHSGGGTLIGWKNNQQPMFALHSNWPPLDKGYSHSYWLGNTIDVDVLSGAQPQPIATTQAQAYPQAIALHCCNSWSGCFEAGCACACIDCSKIRGGSITTKMAAVKVVPSAGMHCSNRACNEFNPYGEPNQPDGKSYRCYGCRQSWRSV